MSAFPSPPLGLGVLATAFQRRGSPHPLLSLLTGGLQGQLRPWIYLRAGGHAWSKDPSPRAPGIVDVGLRRVSGPCGAPGPCGACSERVSGVSGLSDEELRVPGSCESGCSGSGGCGYLHAIFHEPGTPSPFLRFSLLPAKFGARAQTGKVGEAASAGPWGRFWDARAQLTPAAVLPPAGADPTLRGRGPAPAASAHNFSLLLAEAAASQRRRCALPGGGGGEGGREARRGPAG